MKFKVLIPRMFSGHEKGDIIDLNPEVDTEYNADSEEKFYEDGLGGLYERQ